MTDQDKLAERQVHICRSLNTRYDPPVLGTKVGISLKSRLAGPPLNGLRHSPHNGTNGWYIWWGGQPEEAAHFFDAMHTEHLADKCPEVLEFLGLPPGWRFLIAGNFKDIWFDQSIIRI